PGRGELPLGREREHLPVLARVAAVGVRVRDDRVAGAVGRRRRARAGLAVAGVAAGRAPGVRAGRSAVAGRAAVAPAPAAAEEERQRQEGARLHGRALSWSSRESARPRRRAAQAPGPAPAGSVPAGGTRSGGASRPRSHATPRRTSSIIK